MRSTDEIYRDTEEIRSLWNFTEDPGPGIHELGMGYQLHITEHEIKKGEISTRYLVERTAKPGHPLTMSYNWESFHENLSQPSRVPREEEEIDMTKLSIHDKDLREKVKLKCKNDWDLDLTEDQISMCIIEMEEQKLSIFHNQIWPNRRKWKKKITDDRTGRTDWKQMERITWDKTIDGYRAVAHRTGKFAGVDSVVFDTDDEGQLIARITVYALDGNGKRQPYVGEARFVEFVQLIPEYEKGKATGKKVPNSQWSESPHNQLSVAAERQALRKAFQETDDDNSEATELPPTQEPEPDLEDSRGQETPLPPDASPPADTAAPKREEKPKEEKKEEKPKGEYVGIPKSGFQISKMYNKNERIVLLRKLDDGGFVLALDSGKRVTVSSDGYETERIDRSDKNKGGRPWKKGDVYYDGSKVEKTADSKKDEWSLRVALDNGFEVRLNRWGKETKKKERKKGKTKEEDKPSSKDDEERSQDSPPPDARASEADAPGKKEPVDIDDIDNVEMMRKVTTPLLKKWCTEIFKRRVNPKDAYKEFTGVVLKKGQSMSLDDYKVLYQCLEEAIEAAENE